MQDIISYIFGRKKGKGNEPIEIEGNISLSEDQDGYIVIEEETDGE